jgi:hypothetical protein
MTQPVAPRALIALVFRGSSFHDPFHEPSGTEGDPRKPGVEHVVGQRGSSASPI